MVGMDDQDLIAALEDAVAIATHLQTARTWKESIPFVSERLADHGGILVIAQAYLLLRASELVDGGPDAVLRKLGEAIATEQQGEP